MAYKEAKRLQIVPVVLIFAIALWTGCTQPSLEQENSEVADSTDVANVVGDCGADPSGQTDSEPAFERCVDLVTGSDYDGGTVEVPAGEYVLDSPVDFESPRQMRVRFVGETTKYQGSQITVNDDIGFNYDAGALASVSGASFERIDFGTDNPNATAIRFKQANHSVIRECWFEDFNVAVEYDSNVRVAGHMSDASYHVIEGGTRFRDNMTAVLVTDDEGGFEMFGGEISMHRPGSIGVDIRGGWQQRIVATKFEGQWNNGDGIGTGIRTQGSYGQFTAFQTEALSVGVHVEEGKKNHIDGFFSNAGDNMIAIRVDRGAQQTVLPDEYQYMKYYKKSIVNHSTSTHHTMTAELE